MILHCNIYGLKETKESFSLIPYLMVAAASIPAFVLAASSALWQVAQLWGETPTPACHIHDPQEPLEVTCHCEREVTCSSKHQSEVHCETTVGWDWFAGSVGASSCFSLGLIVGLWLRRAPQIDAAPEPERTHSSARFERPRQLALKDGGSLGERGPTAIALPY